MRAVICLIIGAVGCGSVTTKTSTDMAMPTDGATNADLRQVVGTDGAPQPDSGSSCQSGQPCLYAGGNGLCVSGSCVACNDPADDSACVTSYGAGNLCIAGSCTFASCRSSSDCGGAPCIGNQCTPCGADGDCAAGQVCNTTTFACVASAQCGAAAEGDACPVNANDKCCNAGGLVCEAVDCCTAAQCPANNSCTSGVCVPNSCSAVTAGLLYVDFATATPGAGSSDCPFNTIAKALAVATSGTTVVVKGGTHVDVSNERIIPAGVTLSGGTVPTPSPGPFALCDSTTCADSSTWPKITLNGNKNNGVQMSGANSALRYFQVVGPGAATSGHYGVYVSPAPSTANVTVDHLRVSGFLIGLLAVSGTLSIGADVQATANSTGLGCGATCNVVIGVGEPKTSFDKNNVGVWAIGSAALLTVNGPANMIGADHNGAVGVQYNGSLSSTLTGMVMTGNGATPSGWGSKPTGGIVVLGPSLKLRGVNIHDNTGYGAYIRQNQKSPSLSGIDFGASSSDVGGNTFKGNSLTGLCIQSTDGNFVKGNAITAIGNTFGTNVCTSGTPTLTFGPNCAAGTDVGWFNCPAGGPCDCASNMINASTCTFSISAASGLSCAQ